MSMFKNMLAMMQNAGAVQVSQSPHARVQLEHEVGAVQTLRGQHGDGCEEKKFEEKNGKLENGLRARSSPVALPMGIKYGGDNERVGGGVAEQVVSGVVASGGGDASVGVSGGVKVDSSLGSTGVTERAVVVEKRKLDAKVSSVVLPARVGRSKEVESVEFGSISGESDSVEGKESVGSDGVPSFSWSDDVSDACEQRVSDVADSVKSVVAGVKNSCPVGAGKFGGVVDVVGRYVSGQAEDLGFFKQYVRVSRVKSLCELLQRQLGVKIPKAAMEELALATYSAGTVPTAFVNGQARLKSLAQVGDAAMASLLIDDCYVRGQVIVSTQAVKTSVLTNAFMARSFVASGLSGYVVIPAGVDPIFSKTGADAVEAVAGVINLWRGRDALRAYMVWMQLLQ